MCSKDDFLSFLAMQIEDLQKQNRFGTAICYRKLYNSLLRFHGGEPIPFDRLDYSFLMEYNGFLVSRGLLRNSVSYYMRILRSVYNKACKCRLLERRLDFSDVYTGVDVTRKRAVTEEQMVRILRYDLSEYPALEFVRDIFIFSYCMRGMPFVDVAFLRWDDIKGDIAVYRRRKTRQLMSVRIEGMAWRIIGKYRRDRSHYVFPIIKSGDREGQYRDYRKALDDYNRNLKRLSALVGVASLSSYTVRHSWATIARNHSVPVALISNGLGHTTERMTQIYLDTISQSELHDANSLVIRALETGSMAEPINTVQR